MFSLSEMPEGLIVPWSRLQPGMIFLSGLTVNDAMPKELFDYPVLDDELIGTLRDRYRLTRDRNVRVLTPGRSGLTPYECAESIHKASRKVTTLNNFRKQIRMQRQKHKVVNSDVMKSALVRNDSLILPYGEKRSRPSLLNRLDFSLDVADLFFRDFHQAWQFPEDSPVNIYLVLDYSYSMQASGRDAYVQSAINVFFTELSRILENARFQIYGFSDDCRRLTCPLVGNEIPRKETRYTTFLDEVLWTIDESVPSLVILFTDGLPSDRSKALNRLAMLKARGIDYLQVVFNLEGDKREYARTSGHEVLDGYLTKEIDDVARLSDQEYRTLIRQIKEDFRELTRISGGGQIVLSIDEALALVSVEGFDRWFGAQGAKE